MSGTKHGLKINIKPSAKGEETASFVDNKITKKDSSSSDGDSAAAAADTSSAASSSDDTSTSSAAESSAADPSSSADSSSTADSSSASDSSSQGEAPYDGAALKDDFSDACFIGDSRTVGLEYNSDKAKASFFASTGLNVSTAFTDTVCLLSNGNYGTVIEAVGERKFHRVFVMFGINEIGWPYPDVFVENYVNLLNEIKKAQPAADIYVESVLPVSASAPMQNDNSIFTNENVDAFNGYVKEAAQKAGVKYLDINPYFKDSSGNLPEEAAADGIHFNRDVCLKWIDILAFLVPQKEQMKVDTAPAPAATTTAAAQPAPQEENTWDNGNNGGWDNGGYDNGYGY